MSETSDIVTPALKAIARLGCIAWRVNSGGRRGRVTLAKAGTPDILGVLAPSGRLFGLEAKLPGKKPTDVQRAWHETAIASGVRIAVVHSVAEAVEVVGNGSGKSEAARRQGQQLAIGERPGDDCRACAHARQQSEVAAYCYEKAEREGLKRMEVGE